MRFWRLHPFVRLLIPLVTGLITGFVIVEKLAELPEFIFLFPVTLLVIAIVVSLVKWPYRLRFVPGLINNLVLFVLGFTLTVINTPRLDDSNIVHAENIQAMKLQLKGNVSETEKSYKAQAKVLAVRSENGWHQQSGLVMVYFKKSKQSARLEYGDKVIIGTGPQKTRKPTNPGEFNYASFLADKGVYHTIFADEKTWRLFEKQHDFSIMKWTSGLRQYMLDIIHENGIVGQEYAVVSAILLGYDDFLDAEQKQQFAGAGAMHILCVSGLHVGIITVILSQLLFFLNRTKKTRIVKFLIVVVLIWVYAGITGFSPSVSRASTMFSFIMFGRITNRNAPVINMIAASAFVLLVINPYMLKMVGFQLSYLAVTGIVLLFKPIYSLFTPGNKLLDYIWQISVVSLCATLVTFPLSLYYFHQFPMLFLITNLVAIPASMLILYLGILVIATAFIPVVSKFIGIVLSWVVKGLNYSVYRIEGLSFSTIQNISIGEIELLLIFLMIISVIILLTSVKRKSGLTLLLSSSLILLLLLSMNNLKNFRQQEVVVFDVRGRTVVEFVSGKNALCLADTSTIANPDLVSYQVEGAATALGLKNVKWVGLNQREGENAEIKFRKGFVHFGDRIFHVADNSLPMVPKVPYQVDCVVLCGNVSFTPNRLTSVFSFESLIMDSSVPYYQIERWRKAMDELNINFHSTRYDGAWVLSRNMARSHKKF